MASPQATVLEQISGQGRTVSKSNTYTGSGSISIEETVADAQTDFEINVDIDVSAIKAIYINSTQDVTLETNSGSSPADTISLTANKPYVWTADSYFSNLLTTDVTSMFFTNASGGQATISVEVVYDTTP